MKCHRDAKHLEITFLFAKKAQLANIFFTSCLFLFYHFLLSETLIKCEQLFKCVQKVTLTCKQKLRGPILDTL